MPDDYDGLVLSLSVPDRPSDTDDEKKEEEEYIMDWSAEWMENTVFIYVGGQ